VKLDENEFFRQVTLRICSSLDIERALFNCLQYIQLFMPASALNLGLFEPSTGVLRSLATVDNAGRLKTLPPTLMTPEAIMEIESVSGATEVRHIDARKYKAVHQLLRPHVELSDSNGLAMNLSIENKRLGTLAVMAEGKAKFNKTHAHLLSLLREPFAIAMSNALRYEEVVRLKDIVDAENRELSELFGH